ncbi:MAG: hypothetical protein HRU18_16695 [Pseudoalteromonas sp.]|uniref:hypothetical protein n=1 Tax=Pseudoalteromonas sp. TaxID=53249 RepID=UPI001D8517AD|nr:hypothetical protein [Pseudoalteromonas sp.]NRA79845.1 hypothetical protein [Pseudoalteromonas sp.]
MAAFIPLAAAAFQVGQQRAQADVELGESKVQAEQEELGAVQRESDRKERLSIALASQNAAAGAGGIAAFEGSPLTVLKEDVRREEVATKRDAFSTKLSSLTTRSRGKARSKSLRSQSLLTSAKAVVDFSGKT